VGVAALEGRPGVQSVKRGWLGLSEINRVVYDPAKTTITQLVEWLKEAGTYIRTVSEPTNKNNQKERRERDAIPQIQKK